MTRTWSTCLADEEVAHGHGPSHHDLNPAAHAHESEPVMTWPLIILAVCSIFVGWTVWLGLPLGTPVLEKMIEYGEPANRDRVALGALVCPGLLACDRGHGHRTGSALLRTGEPASTLFPRG